MTTTYTTDDRAVQGTLSETDEPATNPGLGYRGPTVCQIAGISYRQIDYWTRTNLIEASVSAAAGSGSQRLYSFRDILIIKIIRSLLNAGISLQNIRKALTQIVDREVLLQSGAGGARTLIEKAVHIAVYNPARR